MLKPILMLAALTVLAGSANAGERYQDRYAAPPPPAPGAARYYGPVNNYYAPVTIYAAPESGGYVTQPAPSASSYGYGYSYGPGYATPPECDANCYGAGYDWSHGNGSAYGGYGGGYAYPAQGSYGYGYSPSNDGARMNPWNGYNGGFNNGY